MLSIYQKEWQEVQFSSFARVSSKHLADADFYNAFYREFFRRYHGYDDLDPEWRREKRAHAEWIAGRVEAGWKVLSIGCGLGYMELCLHRDHRDAFEIHVQDFASDALAWLRAELPDSRVHLLGGGEATLTGGYDLIYLSNIDYAIPDGELVALLRGLKPQLAAGGTCLVISPHCIADGERFVAGCRRWFKDTVKAGLEHLGLYQRGQLWGWRRTQPELRGLFRKAGYSTVDGFFSTGTNRIYFIEGKVHER